MPDRQYKRIRPQKQQQVPAGSDDSTCWRTLRQAAQQGDFASVQKSLRHNQTVQQLLSNHRACAAHLLLLAVQANHVATVRALSRLCGPGLVHMTTTNKQRTPLQVAAEQGHVQMVKFLLAQQGVSASANGCSIEEESPLYLASRHGHESVVNLLLQTHNYNNNNEQIANVQCGETPLYVACQHGHAAVVRRLLLHYAKTKNPQRVIHAVTTTSGDTCLLAASRGGHKTVVNLLLQAGTNIHNANPQGWTALHVASRAGHAHVVKLLLQRGALVNRQVIMSDTSTIQTLTPLMLASQAGRIAVLHLFFYAGANVNVRSQGCTALAHAVARHQVAAATALLQYGGARVQASGRTCFSIHDPLFLAAEAGHVDLVKLLVVDYRADPNHASLYRGNTPLSVACKNGHLPVVRVLVEQGAARLNVRDEGTGHTPLDWAAGHETVLDYLQAIACLSPCDHCPLRKIINSRETAPRRHDSLCFVWDC